jgi:hypothetical protein
MCAYHDFLHHDWVSTGTYILIFVYITFDDTDMHQHRMALHRNSDAETMTMTIELPALKQRDVNVEAHGKHLSIFLDQALGEP